MDRPRDDLASARVALPLGSEAPMTDLTDQEQRDLRDVVRRMTRVLHTLPDYLRVRALAEVVRHAELMEEETRR